MVGAEYTIYKRDSDGKRGNPIDKFTSLKIEQRWTEPSKWSLDSTGLSRIPVTIGDGIIIYRNGEWFLSGIVEAANEHCNEAEQGIITWHCEGRDMTSLLERRLVLPDPVGLQFDESIQDVLVDSAEGAIRRYVERNAGASAATGRRLGGLTVDAITPDPNGDKRAYRLKTLAKVCAEIGAGELSPEITWNPETGVMELEVNARREKADDVVFSPEYGTVISWEIKRKLPKKNAIWAISGGTGADQVVTFSKQDESIAAFGRFEGFIKDSAQVEEAKDGQPAVTTSDVTNILLSKANEELRKNAATETYTVEVREGVNTLFYEHWRCGDRVTCVIDGESIISTIDSVSIVFADDGEKVQATIGDVEKGIFASLFEDIAELQKAVETEQSTSSAAAITSGGSSSSVLDAYPIGSIYMSVNSTNPGTLFGGTWQAWGAGRVPVGFDSSQSEFDTAEETGGEKTHTLTVSEMPSHRHWVSSASRDDGNGTGCGQNSQDYGLWADAGSYSANDPNKKYGRNTAYTGGNGSHNNLQPYLVCYIWERTA